MENWKSANNASKTNFKDHMIGDIMKYLKEVGSRSQPRARTQVELSSDECRL